MSVFLKLGLVKHTKKLLQMACPNFNDEVWLSSKNAVSVLCDCEAMARLWFHHLGQLTIMMPL
jgi:hypothetical protein